MKYKKIQRSLEETIEFLKEIDWSMTGLEINVFEDYNYIDEYLEIFADFPQYKGKPQQVVNFFWEDLEEEIPYGTFCKFWNKRCKYPEDYGFYGGKYFTEYIKMNINGIKESMWDSCEPVNEIPKLEQGK
jgi:hypothetical protein